MVELCRNFSRGAFKVRNRKKEKVVQADRNHCAEGESVKRVWNGRAKQTRVCDPESSEVQASPTDLKQKQGDNLPCAHGERGVSMLYGINSVFDHVSFSADALLLDDAASTRPPARAPDRPSSTR
jgi:hypothetical protein